MMRQFRTSAFIARAALLGAAACALAACSSETVKSAVGVFTPAPDEAPTVNSRPKEIRQLAPSSSLVLDKYCPRIVEPYRLTDNLLSVGQLAAQVGLNNGLASLPLGTPAPAQPARMGSVPVAARLAAKQLNWLPMSMERAYGEGLHKDKALEVLPRNKKSEKAYQYADKILADVRASIDEPHDYELKLFILKDAGTMALSYPGGYIYIGHGLTDPKMKSKAYFAVAHEVAHIMQRHETRELQGQVVDSVSTGSDLLKMVQGKSTPADMLNLLSSTKKMFAKHFVDQELAADACATRMMVRMFPKPQEVRKALLEFENSLDKPEPEPAEKPATSDLEKYALTLHTLVNSPMRRHPNSLARRKNIEEMYAQIALTPAKPVPPGEARKS